MTRKLRPSIERALTKITVFLALMLVMVNDIEFTFNSLVGFTCWIGIIVVNYKILIKYGRKFPAALRGE